MYFTFAENDLLRSEIQRVFATLYIFECMHDDTFSWICICIMRIYDVLQSFEDVFLCVTWPDMTHLYAWHGSLTSGDVCEGMSMCVTRLIHVVQTNEWHILSLIWRKGGGRGVHTAGPERDVEAAWIVRGLAILRPVLYVYVSYKHSHVNLYIYMYTHKERQADRNAHKHKLELAILHLFFCVYMHYSYTRR